MSSLADADGDLYVPLSRAYGRRESTPSRPPGLHRQQQPCHGPHPPQSTPTPPRVHLSGGAGVCGCTTTTSGEEECERLHRHAATTQLATAQTRIGNGGDAALGQITAAMRRNEERLNRCRQAQLAVLAEPGWQPIVDAAARFGRLEWSTRVRNMPTPTHSAAHRVDWTVAGTAGTIGRRAAMEDETIVAEYVTKSTGHRLWLFGVLDGHGGDQASRFAVHAWPRALFGIFELMRNPLTDDKVRHALARSVALCNDALHRALMGAQDVGTTLCAVLVIDGHRLYTANLGDSRAVAIRAADGAYRRLTEDHKPNRPDEEERIRRLGGAVLNVDGVPRVSGNLAVSRALGDFGLAPFVSGEPEITGPRHVDGLGAIVVACDGVYDVLDDARTAAVVAFQAASHGPQRAAEALRDAAYATGSTDNISVVVVNLAALCPT